MPHAWLDDHLAVMCAAVGRVLLLVRLEDREWVARSIENFVNDDLRARPDVGATNVGSLMRRHQDSRPVDVGTLVAKLGQPARRDPQFFDQHLIARNLAALPLSRCERKLVLWAYCTGADPTCSLQSALMHIVVDAEAGLRLLALLLDEPLQAVHDCTMAPSRLHAMQLVSVPDSKSMTLCSYFEPMQMLASVLETEHVAPHGASEFLRHPLRPWFFDEAAPDALLHEWFEPELADAMSAEMADSDLDAQHVAALVGWACGWPMPVAACTAGIEQLRLLTIQRAVARLALTSRVGAPLKPATVVDALMAAT